MQGHSQFWGLGQTKILPTLFGNDIFQLQRGHRGESENQVRLKEIQEQMAWILTFFWASTPRPPTAPSFSQGLAQDPSATLFKYLNEKLHIICPGFENSFCFCTFTTNIWMYHKHPGMLWVFTAPETRPLRTAPCGKTDPWWPTTGSTTQVCSCDSCSQSLVWVFPTPIPSLLSGPRLLWKVDIAQLCGSDS